MNKFAKFVDDARKEIMLNNMEGTLTDADTAAQLKGVKVVCAVISGDTMSKPLKADISAIEEKIDGALAKLEG